MVVLKVVNQMVVQITLLLNYCCLVSHLNVHSFAYVVVGIFSFIKRSRARILKFDDDLLMLMLKLT